ncbi:MAG: ABC transporter substrate-binding protein [Clostridia bacterium]
MKKILTTILIILLIITLAACNQEADNNNDNEPETTEIRVASLKGPTTMGMAKLIEDKQDNELYNFNIYGTADEIVSQIVNDEVDIALVPCNLASVLYNRTEGKIKVGAINTLGVLYIVENGETVNSMDDLRDKKIYSVGKNTTPEYALNYLLEQNGIDKDNDLTVEYKSEATELAILLNEDQSRIALLPQPYVTVVQMQNENVRIALDLTQEWNNIDNDSSMVTGVLIAREQFIEDNTQVFNTFLDEYASSTDYVNNNHDEAAKLITEFGIVENEAIARKSIPKSNLTYIDGEEMKTKITGYLDVLYEANPQSVGGELPGDDFYYQKE